MLLTGLILSFLAYFAASGVVATRLTRPIRATHSQTPADVGLAFEEVRFPARDGTMMSGWFIPAPGARRVILMVHGLWMNRTSEFGGRWLEYAARLHAHGFALFLMDLRAHGSSDGAYWTMGVLEPLDVLGAVDWLRAQEFVQIGVHGVSLGAASAIEAAAHPDGGGAIRAIVADGAFADLRDLLERHFARVTRLPGWLLPGGVLMTRLLRGTNLNHVQPGARIKDVRAPLLLIHSDGDRLIPHSHFRRLLQARPDAQEWLAANSKHARIYNDYPDEYVARVVDFFNHHLTRPVPVGVPEHRVSPTRMSALQ